MITYTTKQGITKRHVTSYIRGADAEYLEAEGAKSGLSRCKLIAEAVEFYCGSGGHFAYLQMIMNHHQKEISDETNLSQSKQSSNRG